MVTRNAVPKIWLYQPELTVSDNQNSAIRQAHIFWGWIYYFCLENFGTSKEKDACKKSCSQPCEHTVYQTSLSNAGLQRKVFITEETQFFSERNSGFPTLRKLPEDVRFWKEGVHRVSWLSSSRFQDLVQWIAIPIISRWIRIRWSSTSCQTASNQFGFLASFQFYSQQRFFMNDRASNKHSSAMQYLNRLID